ncbi:hypothetical protein JCM21900_005939 [Sporobolomyces salmonicolor]
MASSNSSRTGLTAATRALHPQPRPSLSSVRAFASSASSASAPSSSSPVLSGRPTRDPHAALYRRVVRTAVLGALELSPAAASSPSSPAPAAPSRGGSVLAHRFRPTPIRRVPGYDAQRRARLVAVDPSQVQRTGGGRPERARGEARNVGGREQRRAFGTSAGVERAVSEETLAVEDEEGVDEGGVSEGVGASEGRGRGHGVGMTRARALRPGDWVETRRHGDALCGIYLCPASSTTRRFVFLPQSGTRHETSLDDVTFTVPSLVAPSLAARANLENAPELNPSDGATLEMLQKMRAFSIAVEKETKMLVARGANDLYRILLSPTSTSRRSTTHAPPKSITVPLALSAIRLPPSSPSHTVAREVAMHRMLFENPQYFIADSLMLRTTGRFDLRAQDEAERFETVRGWVRAQGPEIKGFADRAARVREWARARQPTRSTGEPLTKLALPKGDPAFTWTPSDLSILAFLRDALAYERLLQSQPHMAVAPSVLKLVDERSGALGFDGWGSESAIDKGRLRAFLTEIGDVAPWENWTTLEKTTGLREWEEMGSKVETALKDARSRGKAKAATAKVKLSSREYYPTDPHDSVRHDFGAVKVYTIDDPGAFELDDGISLAPGPPASSGGGKTWWIHVHVADPTALLHPSHLLAELARARDQTEYLPEKTWSMFPDSFVASERLSLGSTEGREQLVLSLGMRVDEATGEVLESEVKAGVVRSVMRLTYGAVDKALGYEALPPGRTLVYPAPPQDRVGELPKNVRTRPTDDAELVTDEKALSDLRTLHQLAAKLLRRRVDSTAMFWHFPRASVSVSPSLSPHFAPSPQPTFYASSPLVTLRLPAPNDHTFLDSPSQLLVSEFMVAANRAAARFSVAHGLPAPFRSQPAPSSDPAALEAVLKLRNPVTGQVSASEILKHKIEFLPGLTTATPAPHWPMGIDDEAGYLRVTSPLRRYTDLFSHWQLKSALLPSASSSSSAPSFATPRFDLDTVLAHIQGFDQATKARGRLGQAAESFWSLYLLKHKLALLRSASSPSSAVSSSSLSAGDEQLFDLLENGLTAVALRSPSFSAIDNIYVQPVVLLQLGLRGTLQVDKESMGAAMGEEVAVRIADVVLSARSKVTVTLK